jgi:acetylornithine deacetylase/succinyl-diaminopimelate desuccinylase-like protein
LQRLRELLRRHAPGSTLAIHRAGPAFVTPRHSPWAAQLGAAARGWTTADWFCDANVAAKFGVPGVAFGPGSIRQAHTRDEYITGTALAAGCTAFARFLTCAAPSTRTAG